MPPWAAPLAAPLEPAYDELNPPLEPPKEYRLSLGATVYLGSQEYELLAFDEQTVRLYDRHFPSSTRRWRGTSLTASWRRTR